MVFGNLCFRDKHPHRFSARFTPAQEGQHTERWKCSFYPSPEVLPSMQQNPAKPRQGCSDPERPSSEAKLWEQHTCTGTCKGDISAPRPQNYSYKGERFITNRNHQHLLPPSITDVGMTSMFLPMINSGLRETLLAFVPFFFPPRTQVRDKLLTLESSSRTGLEVEPAQQFLFSNPKVSLLQRPTENRTATNSGI